MTNNFLGFSIKFIFFYLILFFLGRGIHILLNNFKKIQETKNEVFGININIFYPILGLIYLGNFLIILNFFLPLNSLSTYILLLPVLVNIKSLPKIKIFKNLPFYLIFLIPSYDVTYNYDAGLYHLGFQNLLRENNIVLGVSNIYGPYGVSSIYDYISSALWFDKDFVFFQFLNVIFIVFFYEFLYQGVVQKKYNILKNISICLIIFSILDNFGFGGGRNGFIYFQGIGKQDIAVAVLFLITAILIYLSLISIKLTVNEFFIISLLSIFIIQLKVSGFPILFFYMFMIFQIFRQNKFNYKFISTILTAFFIGAIWIIKTVLQTGCIIYPLSQTCFERLKWTSIEYTNITRESAINFSNYYSFNYSFLDWFNNYIDYELNKIIIYNFLISFLIIKILFFKRNFVSKNKFKLSMYFLFLVSLIFYLYFGPDSRYLIGIQLFFVSLIGIFGKPRFEIKEFVLISLIFLSSISLIRLSSYQNFDLTTSPKNTIPVPEVIFYDNRLTPKDGDQCWAVINCSPNKFEYQISYDGFFKIVELKYEK